MYYIFLDFFSSLFMTLLTMFPVIKIVVGKTTNFMDRVIFYVFYHSSLVALPWFYFSRFKKLFLEKLATFINEKHEILISFFPWNYWTISSHDLEVGCIRKSNFGFSYVPNFKAFRWITSSSINLLLTKSLQVYHIVKLKLLVVTYCSREIDQNFFFFTKKNFFLTIWFCPKLFVFYYCSSRIHHFLLHSLLYLWKVKICGKTHTSFVFYIEFDRCF